MKTRSPQKWVCPRLDRLEDRSTPAFAGVFDAAAGVLTITGTDFPDAGTISRDVAGNILLDGQLIPDSPTVSNTDTIRIHTGGSQDFVKIDQTAGAFGPGVTAEATGLSEIEIQIDNGGTPDDLFVYGTNAADVIEAGTTGGQILINLNGDDDADIVVNAGVAGLGLFGQDGNDVLSGAGTPVVGDPVPVGLWGGAGDDLTKGGEGIFNSHFGGPGNDTMVGGKTIDRYFFAGGNLGHDTIRDVADGNNDTLIFCDIDGSVGGNFAGPVRVSLSTTTPQVVNPGNLTLTLVNFGVDHVIGSVYDDVIVANNKFQSILFGGQDYLGQSGNDLLIGQSGNDWLYGQGGRDVLIGGGGDDQLFGGDGHDRLTGGVGNDVLRGEAGDDRLYGSAGDDDLYGGQGRDRLFGQAGADYLNGGNEGNPADGTPDQLIGGTGPDQFDLGLGDIVLDFNAIQGDQFV
jgi:Ca2+-binding RTX toxin-like protein